jgi:hypothetical protein
MLMISVTSLNSDTMHFRTCDDINYVLLSTYEEFIPEFLPCILNTLYKQSLIVRKSISILL